MWTSVLSGSPARIRTRVSTLREWAAMSSGCRSVLFSQVRRVDLSCPSTRFHRVLPKRWTTGWTILQFCTPKIQHFRPRKTVCSLPPHPRARGDRRVPSRSVPLVCPESLRFRRTICVPEGPIAGGSAREHYSARNGTWAVHSNAVSPLRLCRSEPAVCRCPSRADRERRGPRNLPFALRSGPSSQ